TAGLRELGVDVTLAIAAGSRWEHMARELGVPVETFPQKSPLKFAMMQRVAALIRERGFDILHAHQGRDYWPSVIAARLAMRGTRVVVTRHMMTRPRTVSRWLLLRCADVIAVSCAVEEVQLRELRGPRARLHQIYGGIDTVKFQPQRTAAMEAFRRERGWGADAVVFGVVGAFDLPGGKGQREFFEAAARLKDEFPRARFAVIGAGTMESLLREQIASRGLGGIATMIPFTNDIVTAIGALDVLVHPAVGTEALGLVLWEAMASGKPVIASRLHGIPEAFIEGEHGLLVPPGDVAAITKAMRTLLLDPAMRARFGAAGREHVCRNFSRRAQAERMLALYRRLCGEAAP
ncbi:MAG: glycosyltransferase family 4 protein, partial [Verrucomicrobia bacterium]|nr:glycosyltransferase family 4 protein [Verrucomicrobiota bacterium]